MTEPKDAFDRWHEWATKSLDSELSIPADLHGAVMALAPDDRQDRDKVNRAVSEARDPNAQHIWIYESSDRLESFRSEREAETWLKQNDPEGVAFKHGTADQNDVLAKSEVGPIWY
jgi:hypothetical protein